MKKLFENWRKHLNEAEYVPGHDRYNHPGPPKPEPEDTGRADDYDEELEAEDKKARAIAQKYGLEASADYASDDKLAILVRTPDYDYVGFHSAEEFKKMMKTLAAEGLSGDEMHQEMVRRQEEYIRDPGEY
jgi:hypothetical protein